MSLRKLTLMRHAQAVPTSDSGRDFDRPLSEQGRADAMAQTICLLTEQPQAPDLILTSSAARALETARLFATGFQQSFDLILKDRRLYEESPIVFLDLLQEQPSSFSHVMVVSHNPQISEFAMMLCPEAVRGFSPATVLQIEFEVESWRDVVPGIPHRLVFYQSPIRKKY